MRDSPIFWEETWLDQDEWHAKRVSDHENGRNSGKSYVWAPWHVGTIGVCGQGAGFEWTISLTTCFQVPSELAACEECGQKNVLCSLRGNVPSLLAKDHADCELDTHTQLGLIHPSHYPVGYCLGENLTFPTIRTKLCGNMTQFKECCL